MSDIFRLILALSLSGSVLILVLIALQPLLRHRLSKAWQYYLWVIVLFRLVIPYTPSIGPISGLLPPGQPAAVQATENTADSAPVTSVPNISPSTVTSPASAPAGGTSNTAAAHKAPIAIDMMDMSGVIWLSGAVLMFLFKAFRYALFSRHIRSNARSVTENRIYQVFMESASLIRMKKKPALLVSVQVSSPMLVGLFSPAVLLPESILSVENDGLPYVLRHELTHLKRRDILYKWAAEIILCIHWFNPLVYIMARRISEACELSCDEAVACRLNAREKQSYGKALLDAAAEQNQRGRRLLSTALREDKSNIKERLRTILKTGKKTKAAVIVSIMLALILCLGGVFLGACAAGSTSTPSASSPSPHGTGTTAPVSSSPTETGGSGGTPDSGIVYSNTDYGFDFTLPQDWQSYTIVSEKWAGTPIGDTGITAAGPEILIRSPKWTAGTPTQDIPIMVFTLSQWDALTAEKFAVSAAPIPPSELGRNSSYVFALPPRYNFASLPGYEEVEQIMSGKPLRPTEKIGVLPTDASASPAAGNAIVYDNKDYGFKFNLPADWAGYTVVTNLWKGTPLTEGGKEESGPQLLLRSPKWTEASPTQDIPIMVFTLSQWDALQQEKFSVSAAPIPPSELGRNNKYVFALPARYNYAYLPGYEEVQDILNGNPISAYDVK